MEEILHSNTARQPMPEIRTDDLMANIPLPYQIITVLKERDDSLSVWEIIWWLVKSSPKIIYILYKLVTLIGKVKTMMKDKSKTTFMATAKVIIALLVTVIGLFGLNIPAETQTALLTLLGAGYFIFDWVQGFFTEDKPEKK